MDVSVFIKEEVKPALGCTEPGAVALAAAVASKELASDVEKIHLKLSANIFKNGLSVGIPGLKGKRGNLLAAALGALGGQPEKGLMALEDVSEEIQEKAWDMLCRGLITQEVVQDVPSVYVEADVYGKEEWASCVISGKHDRVVEVRHNGGITKRLLDVDSSVQTRPKHLDELMAMNMKELWELASQLTDEDEVFLLSGSEMNLNIAEAGLREPWGIGVGYTIKSKTTNPEDLLYTIKAACGAAADVRMAGGPYPVMSSAGSGNHGITAILPPTIVARKLNKSKRDLAEALLLSHLVTSAIKAHTGRLTPICGCTVAAGSGAAAAIVRLYGGSFLQAQQAVGFLTASLLGMICDGAKESCALKVATAAGEAFLSAVLALEGRSFSVPQGLISSDFTESARSIGILSREGMMSADVVMLKRLSELNEI
ncbi:serine dehydratase subunit alpha family protein [Thermovirga sp.]|uniref:L-cysteine desulfidase family protein n=1 Tax=Thermovirga sp. TaxID=2699834 RepID=UPI0025EA8D12|nr:L-serine ammonia-lyase, iron-sulfur-dependent, subunit alpha [Thermovirga sp.]MBO8154603.1 serine dehydratase subunit alpha family protein [Thermovirga sp.]